MTKKTDSTAIHKREINAEKVIALLKRQMGATLDEIVQKTGWLPHPARAAMTGFKKMGHTIEQTKPDDVSRYKIAAAAGSDR